MMNQIPADPSPRENSAWLAYLTATTARVNAAIGLIRRCSGENNTPATDAARNLADREILAAVHSLKHAQSIPQQSQHQAELLQEAAADVAQARAEYESAVTISVIDHPDMAAPPELEDWHSHRLRVIATVQGMQVLAQRALTHHLSSSSNDKTLAYADAVHIGNEIAEDEKEKIVQRINQGLDEAPRPKGANRRLNQQAEHATIDQVMAVNKVKFIRRPYMDLMVADMLYQAGPDMEILHQLYHRFQQEPIDTLTDLAYTLDPRTGRRTPVAIVIIEHDGFIHARLAHEHFPRGYRKGDAFMQIQALREQGNDIIRNAGNAGRRRYGQSMVEAADHLQRALERGIHDVHQSDIRKLVAQALDGPYSKASVERVILPAIAGENPQLAKDLAKHIDLNQLAKEHRGIRRQPNHQDAVTMMEKALALGLPQHCFDRLAEFFGFDPEHHEHHVNRED